MKDLIVIGGPNGAGKTTAAVHLLPARLGIREFVNADEIARGLSPFNRDRAAIAAGRLMLGRIHDLLRGNESFAIETTCAGRSYANMLHKHRRLGWRITLLYLWLPSPENAIERVSRRVASGGHSIPPDVIVRRYWAGQRNIRSLYLPLADIAAIYDNSDSGRVLIAERAEEAALVIHDSRRWAAMEEGPQ